MKLSIIGLAILLSASAVSAAPKKSPPGPPNISFGKAKQTCSAKQSSIRCCNQSQQGGSHHKVKYEEDIYDMQCNQIDGETFLLYQRVIVAAYTYALEKDDKPVLSICSTTVACCFGDGCIAIAN